MYISNKKVSGITKNDKNTKKVQYLVLVDKIKKSSKNA